jgi:predicted ATPase
MGRAANLIPLIAIEEPESTIHPAAAAIVMDALLEASDKEQVLATTHSPDLLDHKAIKSAQLLAVENLGGRPSSRRSTARRFRRFRTGYIPPESSCAADS